MLRMVFNSKVGAELCRHADCLEVGPDAKLLCWCGRLLVGLILDRGKFEGKSINKKTSHIIAMGGSDDEVGTVHRHGCCLRHVELVTLASMHGVPKRTGNRHPPRMEGLRAGLWRACEDPVD